MKKGIIGKKIGMTQIFDDNGNVIPVTIIEAGPCVVAQKKTVETDGYASVQLGFEDIAEKKLNKAQKGHFKKAGVSMKRHLKEFRLDNAAEMNVETLFNMLLGSLEDKYGVELTDPALSALNELTVGTLVEFTSKNGETAYTVEYASGADRVDMVTLVLRTVLTFVTIPENVAGIEAILAENLDGDGYKFACSLLENFSYMANHEGGMDEIMYTVYQIFYAANVAAHSTEDWLGEFNDDYSFLNQLFKTSDLDFLKQIEISLGDLLNNYTGDIIDDDEIAPNGFIAFFQKIADFFKKIGDFFKNLFK